LQRCRQPLFWREPHPFELLTNRFSLSDFFKEISMNYAVSLTTVPLSRFHTLATQTRVGALPADAEALDVLFDFAVQPPLVVPASTSLDAARRWIRQARARVLIVVDALENFLGMVSVADLFSGKSLLNLDDGATVKATVADILTPKSRLWGIPLAALASATMADLGKTLDATNEAHLLVVDVDRHVVRGLVSRADVVQRLLERPLSIPPLSRAAAVVSELPS
jgi:CBS domain-containing protein